MWNVKNNYNNVDNDILFTRDQFQYNNIPYPSKQYGNSNISMEHFYE